MTGKRKASTGKFPAQTLIPCVPELFGALKRALFFFSELVLLIKENCCTTFQTKSENKKCVPFCLVIGFSSC